MRRFRKCRPEVLAILTAFQAKANKGLSWLPPSWDRSIFLKALEPATALAAPKESKAQLRVRGSGTASLSPVKAMGDGMARECKLPGSKRNKLLRTPGVSRTTPLP